MDLFDNGTNPKLMVTPIQLKCGRGEVCKKRNTKDGRLYGVCVPERPGRLLRVLGTEGVCGSWEELG